MRYFLPRVNAATWPHLVIVQDEEHGFGFTFVGDPFDSENPWWAGLAVVPFEWGASATDDGRLELQFRVFLPEDTTVELGWTTPPPEDDASAGIALYGAGAGFPFTRGALLEEVGTSPLEAPKEVVAPAGLYVLQITAFGVAGRDAGSAEAYAIWPSGS